MHDERMRQEFLDQRDFIASQFRKVKKKMNERFKEINKRFQNVNHRFNKQESEIRDIKA